MYYKSITRMVKLSLSIVVMVFAQAYAAEERTGEGLLPEQNFSHSSENLIGIPSSRGGELRRLLLEHDLSVAVGDNGPYPYTHPTYRLIFEKEGEMGAVHIVLSNHAFPFPCLPDGEQMVILRCDSLKHELSSKEMRNTPGELGLSREILQQSFSRNSYSWFSKLDIEAQNRLKMDHELLHFLKTNFDFDDQENPFDHFHASLLRNYLMDRFYIRVRSMDFAATEHYEEWSGFEPVNVHEIDVLFDIKLDSDEFSTFFNYSEAQLQSMCLDLTPPEDDEELLDFALKLRNPYWLVLPASLQDLYDWKC